MEPSASPTALPKLFLTVHEAAEVMRIDARTIYRAINENAFPAVRIRGRYIVPSRALESLAEEALAWGTCINVADYTLTRRSPAGSY